MALVDYKVIGNKDLGEVRVIVEEQILSDGSAVYRVSVDGADTLVIETATYNAACKLYMELTEPGHTIYFE